MEQPKLGQTPLQHDGRDAVHLAIIPVAALWRLTPGQHVNRNGGPDNPIGIVDPFLKEPVEEGQLFWLCLYPGSVTSLRHVWTSPAFPPAQAPKGES